MDGSISYVILRKLRFLFRSKNGYVMRYFIHERKCSVSSTDWFLNFEYINENNVCADENLLISNVLDMTIVQRFNIIKMTHDIP